MEREFEDGAVIANFKVNTGGPEKKWETSMRKFVAKNGTESIIVYDPFAERLMWFANDRVGLAEAKSAFGDLVRVAMHDADPSCEKASDPTTPVVENVGKRYILTISEPECGAKPTIYAAEIKLCGADLLVKIIDTGFDKGLLIGRKPSKKCIARAARELVHDDYAWVGEYLIEITEMNV